jgi:hypothetical protein
LTALRRDQALRAARRLGDPTTRLARLLESLFRERPQDGVSLVDRARRWRDYEFEKVAETVEIMRAYKGLVAKTISELMLALQSAGDFGVLDVADAPLKAELLTRVKAFSKAIGARAYLVMSSERIAPSFLLPLYQQAGLSGKDTLIVTNGVVWEVATEALEKAQISKLIFAEARQRRGAAVPVRAKGLMTVLTAAYAAPKATGTPRGVKPWKDGGWDGEESGEGPSGPDKETDDSAPVAWIVIGLVAAVWLLRAPFGRLWRAVAQSRAARQKDEADAEADQEQQVADLEAARESLHQIFLHMHSIQKHPDFGEWAVDANQLKDQGPAVELDDIEPEIAAEIRAYVSGVQELERRFLAMGGSLS